MKLSTIAPSLEPYIANKSYWSQDFLKILDDITDADRHLGYLPSKDGVTPQSSSFDPEGQGLLHGAIAKSSSTVGLFSYYPEESREESLQPSQLSYGSIATAGNELKNDVTSISTTSIGKLPRLVYNNEELAEDDEDGSELNDELLRAFLIYFDGLSHADVNMSDERPHATAGIHIVW
ncbi:unnamed protein product [Protopolystoma xenopodis]|uniref:Uncharacterized protein n=1 Tax=Protopolystoma xenopodis TaxID=117903 RepID=A0A3S5CKN3_9PLAT|nr:unnamed protein product [Protopolystoma xenopodis]